MVSQHCNLPRDPRHLLGNIAWLIMLAMPAGLGASVYPPKPDVHQEGAEELPLPSLMKPVTCFGGSLPW